MDLTNPEDMEAQMGAMMGFTTFGAQPDAKKRKTEHESPAGQTSTEPGLHSHPLTHNPAQPATLASPTTPEQPKSAFPTGVPMEIFDKLTWKELEAYRKGVRKENGDLAWFLPSFIEDPWAKLESAGNKS